jgi:hypothetical protein
MQRRFRRIPFAAEVTLSAGQTSWSAELLDVALKGALIGTDSPLPLAPGSQCDLSINLSGSPVTLSFLAELKHCEGTHYGFKFISEDLGTLTHLRKLLELNTGDTEATRSELADWLRD